MFAIVLLQAYAAAHGALGAAYGAAGGDGGKGCGIVYSLSPEVLRRAHALYLWRTGLSVISPLWSILALLALLHFGWSAWLAGWTASLTEKRWLQGLYYAPLLFLLLDLLTLPPAIVGHRISLVYGQSIQGWGSWFLDWSKALAIDMLSGALVLGALFALIRHCRRWWLWFWLLSLPVQVFVVFVLPLAIDPLFNHFEPLQQTNPALVSKLEQVVKKTKISIPPSRMFLMNASRKLTGSNAYVTGFGSSLRIVIWDTSIKNSPEDEILLIFGHELGHYVLHHIEHGLEIGAIASFFFLWAGYFLARAMQLRFAAGWGIRSLDDWAAAPLLLLVAALLSLAAQPLANAVSRRQEHQADVFGEEAVHGIVQNPECVAARSFQRLGEESLEYPAPNPLAVFWSYSHPPIASRVNFAAHYDPWRPGGHPRYFTK